MNPNWASRRDFVFSNNLIQDVGSSEQPGTAIEASKLFNVYVLDNVIDNSHFNPFFVTDLVVQDLIITVCHTCVAPFLYS